MATTLTGTSGADSLSNENSDVVILAYAGNDSIDNNASHVTIDGGAGDDKITIGSGAKNNLIEYMPGATATTLLSALTATTHCKSAAAPALTLPQRAATIFSFASATTQSRWSMRRVWRATLSVTLERTRP